jgi:hypothetical protein
MFQRRVHFFDIDRADRTEILGHDEIRIEIAQGSPVQGVQILAGRHPSTDRRIDLGWGEPGGQGSIGNDPAMTRFGREVTLERHTNDIVTGTHGKKDFSRRRKEGDDPHPVRIGLARRIRGRGFGGTPTGA